MTSPEIAAIRDWLAERGYEYTPAQVEIGICLAARQQMPSDWRWLAVQLVENWSRALRHAGDDGEQLALIRRTLDSGLEESQP